MWSFSKEIRTMVLKVLCDECGNELSGKRNKFILYAKQAKYRFEIVCSKIEGDMNESHLCLGCLKKLISESKKAEYIFVV
jgi:hypothetical protein